jgi:alpha-tubulin suppressor-like RCC1 family protein
MGFLPAALALGPGLVSQAQTNRPSGSVPAWERNDAGQTDVPDEAQSGVVAIAAGSGYSVALKNDGSVAAWACSNRPRA